VNAHTSVRRWRRYKPNQDKSRKDISRRTSFQELPVTEGHESFDTCEPKAVRDV
jgi:hypothetical protein